MKHITIFFLFPLLLLFLFSACNINPKKPIITSKEISPTNVAVENVVPSTEYDFPNVELPQNFYRDSLSRYDSLSRAKYDVYFLQSTLPAFTGFNQAMLQFIEARIKKEQKYLDVPDGNVFDQILHTYQLRPVEIYLDSQIISISNIIDTYTSGANHHNYTRRSFNYDLLTNELIEFDDVFHLQSRSDSTDFVQFAEQHTLNGCSNWGWVYDKLDFSYSKNGIYIYPNLSWACASTCALIPIKGNNFVKGY